MAGEDAVGILPPHGQGGAGNMAHGDLQHALLHPVIDGKTNFDFGNFDGAHHPGAGNVQDGGVFLQLLVGGHPVDLFQLGQPDIIIPGLVQKDLVAGIVDLGHAFCVGGDGPGLMEGIPIVADRGIQQ